MLNEIRRNREYWLPLARGLWVGGSLRTNLPNERDSRASLMIRNEVDKWTAWDFRLNQGDVVQKDYILKTQAPKTSKDISLPPDIKDVNTLPIHVQEGIYGYLLGKNVAPVMIPYLEFSEERQRIIFRTECGKILGRDITENSSAKWVVYRQGKKSYVGSPITCRCIPILVEDLLSYYKLKYALRHLPEYRPIALLGTSVKPDLAYDLVGTSLVHIMLDGDSAGRRAVPRIRRNLMGVRSFNHNLPEGKDPKDLTIDEILNYFD